MEEIPDAFRILINPSESILVLIDLQRPVKKGDASHLLSTDHAAATLISAAKKHGVPVVATVRLLDQLEKTIAPKAGKAIADLLVIDREALNPWRDKTFAKALHTSQRKRTVIAGLYTEGAVSLAALSALEFGFDVYVAEDACAGATVEDHMIALERLKLAMAAPTRTRQVALEWAESAPKE